MSGVTCRVCAIPYDVWPDVCPNCRCAEPAPEPSAETGPVEVDASPQPSGPGSPTGDVDPPGAGPEPPPSSDEGEEAEVPPDYASWTAAELRAECERRGLPTTGLKAVLVARLAGG